MKNSKLTSFQKYKRKPRYNIGIVVFGLVFIYLIIMIVLYFTNKHISVYEVRNGSIYLDTSYTGIAIREESVIKSESSGYVNFISDNEEKIGEKTNVYIVSNQEIKWENEKIADDNQLSSDETEAILMKIQNYTDHYDQNRLKDIYSLKNGIRNVLNKKSTKNKKIQLENLLDKKERISVYTGTQDGILVRSIDGYEDLNEQKLKIEDFSKEKYSPVIVKDNEQISSGTPLYKIVTSDKWKLALLIDDAVAKELKDKTVVKVHFTKDNQDEKGNVEIVKKGKDSIAIITFYKSMIRYASERFLDVELVLEDYSGLKIPKSAIIAKEFYEVPSVYITQGGNSKENGVYLDNGKGNVEFFKVDIYYQDETTGNVYLNPDVFTHSKTIVLPSSEERFTLKKTKSLDGVYCVNKGYAIFKQTIEKNDKSDEYFIVKEGTDYGLSNYDHIVLDGSTVKENDVIF